MSAEQSTPGSGTPTESLAFFDSVCGVYREAGARCGLSEYTYHLGNSSIRLQFAGTALIPVITPALAHLSAPLEGPADLTVYLWDLAQTASLLPHCPWEWYVNNSRGDIPSLTDARIQSSYNQYPGLLNMLDYEQNIAVYCSTRIDRVPFDFRGSPLLHILHWWLQQRGLQLVHGGAVGTAAGGVLIVGKGGSGKSTTTLACLQSGLSYAADDYCLVSTSGEPRVYSLYSSAKIEAENLDRPSFLRPLVSNSRALSGNGEKATIFLQQHLAAKLIASFPLRAILVPIITGDIETRLQTTSRIAALKALTVSTMMQLTGADHDAFDGMARVVKEVQCYSLNLGTDIRQLTRLLEEFVAAQNTIDQA